MTPQVSTPVGGARTAGSDDVLAGLEEAAAEVRCAVRPNPEQVRLARTVAGGVLAFLAVSVAVFLWLFTSTSEATICASNTTATAPIPGLVENLVLDVGAEVEVGQVLARICNPRVDRSRLEDLRAQHAALQARLAAMHAEIAHKTGERVRQRGELERQRAFVAIELDRRLWEARTLHGALAASSARKAGEYRVVSTLFEQQLVARVLHERSRDEAFAGAAAAEVQLVEVARVENRIQALRSGHFIETETPFQLLRVDDLTTRLADLTVAQVELGANLRDLERSLAAEEAQVRELSEAVVVSPVRGRVWKRAATAGRYVNAGAELLELVDTSSLRVEAYFHQRYLTDIAIGDAAVVSPVGSRRLIQGRVTWIGADASAQASTVAPQWVPKQAKAMRVVISIDESDRSRLWVGQRVGATIRPAGAGSPVRGWIAALSSLALGS